MAVTVHTGYITASTLTHVRRTRGTSAHAHHSAHAQWTLGMAAYWFEILLTAPELNDQNVGYFASVSTKPYDAGMSRGGINGQSRNPINASAVVTASVLRQSG